ncbi:MAG: hypothetical protein Q9172_002590 [Xanthocarpia lactea]
MPAKHLSSSAFFVLTDVKIASGMMKLRISSRPAFRKEDQRLKRLQEERAAERRAVEEHAAAEVRAVEQRQLTKAEAIRADAERRREEKDYNTRRARERDEQDEKERREVARNKRAAMALKERNNIQIDQKKRASNLRKEVLQEESKVIEGRKSVSKTSAGRILGEIEDVS